MALTDLLGARALMGERHPDEFLKVLSAVADRVPLEVVDVVPNRLSALAYGDSFLLYTDAARHEDFHTILLGSLSVLAAAIHMGLGARVAVSYGMMEVRTQSNQNGSQRTFAAGPAMLDALEWQERQDWAGGVVTPACWDQVAGAAWGLDPVCRSYLEECDVPLKPPGFPDRLRALDWPTWIQTVEPQNLDMVETAMRVVRMNLRSQSSERGKWDRTALFFSDQTKRAKGFIDPPFQYEVQDKLLRIVRRHVT